MEDAVKVVMVYVDKDGHLATRVDVVSRDTLDKAREVIDAGRVV